MFSCINISVSFSSWSKCFFSFFSLLRFVFIISYVHVHVHLFLFLSLFNSIHYLLYLLLLSLSLILLRFLFITSYMYVPCTYIYILLIHTHYTLYVHALIVCVYLFHPLFSPPLESFLFFLFCIYVLGGRARPCHSFRTTPSYWTSTTMCFSFSCKISIIIIINNNNIHFYFFIINCIYSFSLLLLFLSSPHISHSPLGN